MKFSPENTYHIFNQGNNQEAIFRCYEDHVIFLTLIRKLIKPFCEILSWCLMDNHFHLLVYTTQKGCEKVKQGGIEIDLLTNGIRKLLSAYARIYNIRYNRTGSLFRQKTKSKNISKGQQLLNNPSALSDYIYNCFNYIHQNPVEAGLVQHPSEWEHSSFNDYAGKRNGSLCNKELAAKICGFSSLDFIMF